MKRLTIVLVIVAAGLMIWVGDAHAQTPVPTLPPDPEIEGPPDIITPTIMQMQLASSPASRNYFPEISFPSVVFPAVPAVPVFNLPAVHEFSVPAVPVFNLPAVPEFSVPAVPNFSLPAVPNFSVPAVPEFTPPVSPPSLSSPSFPLSLLLPSQPARPDLALPETLALPSPVEAPFITWIITTPDIALPAAVTMTFTPVVTPTVPSVDFSFFPTSTNLPTVTGVLTTSVEEAITYTMAITSMQDLLDAWNEDVVSATVGLSQQLADVFDMSVASGGSGGGGSGIMASGVSIELGGYTPEGLALEMVSGMDVVFEHARAVEGIAVIGPTAMFVVMGFIWVIVITFIMTLTKTLVLAPAFLIRAWEIVTSIT